MLSVDFLAKEFNSSWKVLRASLNCRTKGLTTYLCEIYPTANGRSVGLTETDSIRFLLWWLMDQTPTAPSHTTFSATTLPLSFLLGPPKVPLSPSRIGLHFRIGDPFQNWRSSLDFSGINSEEEGVNSWGEGGGFDGSGGGDAFNNELTIDDDLAELRAVCFPAAIHKLPMCLICPCGD